MNLPITALGIDIAKLKFDVCLIKANGRAKHKVFQNTRHGFEQLARWLDSHQVSNLPASKRPALTASRSPCFCLKPDSRSASLIRQASGLLPMPVCRAPKPIKLMLN